MMKTKKTHTIFRFYRYLAILLYLAIGLRLVVGCAVLPAEDAVTELASIQNQRSANALFALWELEEIDALIKLDNHSLANQFETVLKSQAARIGTYSFKKLNFTFTNQIIILEAIVDIKDEYGNTITTALSGNILLLYRDNGLEWRPRFSQLQISSKDFIFANNSYIEASSELIQITLQNLSTELALAVVENNENTIPLKPVPLGEIQVGASLPGITESTARSTQTLGGVFRIAGSAVLIDSSGTSIALDMAFIPDLSTCPADITVSRAEFAKNIESREPVGIARNMINTADVGYFFSEIAGADRPLTIIHYWFADGVPMAVEELPVGPSDRWRTWSSKGVTDGNATQWEVLVVEKESGCILASKSIRTLEQEILITRVNPLQAAQTFMEFKDEFGRKTSGFSVVHDKPGIALIEVRRAFLHEVLQHALAGLSIDAEFDDVNISNLQFSSQLQSFDTEDVICGHRDCPPAPVCKTSQTQCKRLRDTRDCSSCQFRNPLNNRCVSEAIDPLCEAARNRQNARYDKERAACISHAENARQECDRLNAQVFSSCQIESGFEASACESLKSRLKTHKQGDPLAFISARAQTRGALTANFSNIRIAPGFDSLKMDMRLQPQLQLDGELRFEPADTIQPLAACIATWSTPFDSHFRGTPAIKNLLSNFVQEPDMLTAHWSGFGISFETRPSPLESIFVDNPQLLANCKIGLTVSKVEQAIAGGDAAFFRGQTDLIIQPLPTKIHLAPATIEFGNMVYSATAKLTAKNLQYDIRE